MCNIWKHPTKEADEFKPNILEKLPQLKFANITGGEPMIREDIDEIIHILTKKSKRIVISTSGYYTDKIISLAKKYKNNSLGIRISIEGLPSANDELRGLKDCFDHGLRTLLELQRLGLKDVGFGITVSDRNAKDMIELYQLAKSMNVEFATAVVHNSYYFHKWDNTINNKNNVTTCFEELINELLKSNKIKNWFRAYFNYGLINYIKGNKRLLPCYAGQDMFFIDPYGNIRPCNGLYNADSEYCFGNLNDNTFNELWNSEKAISIRSNIKKCQKNCWMIGTASPAMKKNILIPIIWILKNKSIRLLRRIF